MNQPPQPPADHAEPQSVPLPRSGFAAHGHRRPAWRLPEGVSPGTWEYTQQEAIATGYREFIANTPLVELDSRLLGEHLPAAAAGRGSRVVDFGCGDGRTMRTLWAAGYDVLGVDLSQPMLRQVAAGPAGKAFEHKRIRANLVQLECLAEGIAAHGVCLFSTIGMIRGRACRRRFLQHAARIVRPGGSFVLHVHNRHAAWRSGPARRVWLRSAWSALTERGHEWGDQTYGYRGLADMFLHSYSLAELKSDLTASGWTVGQIIPLSITSGEILHRPHWLPGLRAGGFIAIARNEN